MKKTLLSTSLLTLFISCTVDAQESSADDVINKQWVGVFGHVYFADRAKFITGDASESSPGFGVEYGYKFNKTWSARFEIARVNIKKSSVTDNTVSAESVGLDALYFVDQNSTYIFGGYRNQNFFDTKHLMIVGAGKHWQLKDNWKITTEIGAMHDFGQPDNDIVDDVITKIGVTYTFDGIL
jgi:OOP family OmpA-OmpF porin